jgi:hypothetical protein
MITLKMERLFAKRTPIQAEIGLQKMANDLQGS